MIFKIIAFLAAAIPIFLFVRSIFFRRTTRINEGLSEFKKQANLAVSIFLFLIVCVVVFAAGKLAWTVVVTLNASATYRDGMVQS
jgi:glucan phosphoethanolaminetransferase (alkaline phosphatase superfamily)